MNAEQPAMDMPSAPGRGRTLLSVRNLRVRFGSPLAADGIPLSLVIVAMGKLGGRELNFSSDIDLVFCFRAGGETAGGERSLSHQEFFDRLGKRLIAFLNDVTPDGFVYRVDMRLRPFGESGALTASFAALEQYYQLHGRDWERYALIKARVIHGSTEDTAALAEIWRPFIYRRYLDFGAIESVREMKAMIDAEVARDGALTRDIKRGAGGIREVEFIGQALQLLEYKDDQLKATAHVIIGNYSAAINKKDDAIKEFDKSISITFSFMEAYLCKAQVLMDMNKYEEAIKVLENATKIKNSFDEGYYYLGQCYEKIKNKDMAIESYRRALLYSPDYQEAADALQRLSK